MAPQKKIQRTPQESRLSTGRAFTLILPNLIYKLKTLLPKPKRKKKGI